MSFQTLDDALTYERHFGLNEKPFSLNSDPRFTYDSPPYAATFAALLAGIRRREGLSVLTGEIGTGKTTLCRAVLRELGRKTYSSLVPDPFASREDLLKMLLIDFGVLSIRDLTTGPLRGATRTELGYLLSEFLNSLTADTFVVVVIDEAQNLSLPLIEETRILSDTFGARGRLQLVYVGQPELHAKLKLPEMRQVDQRVCGYHRLGPLSREAVAGYVRHRLQAAGGDEAGELFPADIVDALHQRSGGVPRLINRICDRALHLAFERQAAAVNRETLDVALAEIGSTTLLPTWDSIVFAETPAPQAELPEVPKPAPGAAAASSSVEVVEPVGDIGDFGSEIAEWVEQELATASRTTSTVDLSGIEPLSNRRAGRRLSASREYGPSVKREWPRDLRAETYLQRLRRVWGKRVAIAVAVLIALNVAAIGSSALVESVTEPMFPAVPDAPEPEVAAPVVPATQAEAMASPEAPVADTAASAVPVEPDAVSAPAEYFVAVGLFASPERANELADSLTQAGLPAMQRAVEFRQQQVQQIVLGPFLSRADAVADLHRLQALGGYDDAAVINSQDPGAGNR